MKQVISELLAKATEFLQQLAAKNTGSHSINIEELRRSVSSATLNLRSRASQALSGSGDSSVEAEPVSEVEATVNVNTQPAEPVTQSISEPVVVTVAEPVAETVVVEEVKPQAVNVEPQDQLPEDFVSRRHSVAQRLAEIHAELGNEPSDSTLKRHYQQLLATKISE